MLRITIELLKHGDEQKKKTLGVMEISNIGTGTREIGNYEFQIFKWGKPGRVWKRGKFSNFPRIKYGPWDLLGVCLMSSIGARILQIFNKNLIGSIK